MISNQNEPIFGERYEIEWGESESGEIGRVWNYSVDNKGRRFIPIRFFPPEAEKINFRYIAHTWNKEGPQINLKKDFFDLPSKIRESFLWHEVGHIHFKHSLNSKCMSQDEIKSIRLDFIKKGDVWPIEIEADIFAVKNVGKSTYIEALKFLKDTRQGKRDSLNELGKREVLFRLRRINELKI